MQIDFKFNYLDESGVQSFLMKKKGRVTAKGLILNDELISYRIIKMVKPIDHQKMILILNLPSELPEVAIQNLVGGSALLISTSGINLKRLSYDLNQICSEIDLEFQSQRLEADQEVRSEVCPRCKSHINLTGADQTPQVDCDYCELVFDIASQKPVMDGDHYKICPECSYFESVKTYSEFYFYFLIFIYGWSHKKREMCSSCAPKLGFKTFFINLIFILGVPSSLWIFIKSKLGRSKDERSLSKANSLLKKGQFKSASQVYSRISHMDSLAHPGFAYNQALSAIKMGDEAQFTDSVKQCFETCANYKPMLEMIEYISSDLEYEVD